MKLSCPYCLQPIPSDEINVSADLAKCTNCGELSKASRLIEEDDISNEPISWDPPTNSKITVSRKVNGDILISYPSKGIAGLNWFVLVFSIFWIGFITVWTGLALFMAKGGASFMALFSIPFWLAGFGMILAQLRSMTQKEELHLSKEQILIRRMAFLRNLSIAIPYASIESISYHQFLKSTEKRMKSFQEGLERSTMNQINRPFPCIQHEGQQTYFFTNADEAESKWAYRIVKSVVLQKTDNISSR